MRLIDADELKRAFIGNRYGTKAIEYVIDDAPTVKAISVEWINSYTTGLIFSDDYEDNADSIDDYIYCIKEMVRDWEKENEANVER